MKDTGILGLRGFFEIADFITLEFQKTTLIYQQADVRKCIPLIT